MFSLSRIKFTVLKVAVPVLIFGIAQSAFSQAKVLTTKNATGESAAHWYFGIDSGMNIRNEDSVNAGGATFTGKYDAGPVIGLESGFRFGNSFSAYGSFDYLQNSSASINSLPDKGSQETYAMLANIQWQFTIAKFIPYISAGAGAAIVRDSRIADNTSIALSGHSTEFVWAAGAGFRYQLLPNFYLGLGYQFMHVQAPSFSVSSAGRPGVKTKMNQAPLLQSVVVQIGTNI